MPLTEIQKKGRLFGTEDEDEKKLAWLRQALEWQKETDDSPEFLETFVLIYLDHQVF